MSNIIIFNIFNIIIFNIIKQICLVLFKKNPITILTNYDHDLTCFFYEPTCQHTTISRPTANNCHDQAKDFDETDGIIASFVNKKKKQKIFISNNQLSSIFLYFINQAYKFSTITLYQRVLL